MRGTFRTWLRNAPSSSAVASQCSNHSNNKLSRYLVDTLTSHWQRLCRHARPCSDWHASPSSNCLLLINWDKTLAPALAQIFHMLHMCIPLGLHLSLFQGDVHVDALHKQVIVAQEYSHFSIIAWLHESMCPSTSFSWHQDDLEKKKCMISERLGNWKVRKFEIHIHQYFT